MADRFNPSPLMAAMELAIGADTLMAALLCGDDPFARWDRDYAESRAHTFPNGVVGERHYIAFAFELGTLDEEMGRNMVEYAAALIDDGDFPIPGGTLLNVDLLHTRIDMDRLAGLTRASVGFAAYTIAD